MGEPAKIAIGKYMYAVEHKIEGKKTTSWFIHSLNGFHLGMVGWFPRWRQYVFDPSKSTFNADCLRGLSDFLIRVNAEHKQKT